MKDIMSKLAELEATAPKTTKKKMLKEDSTTPPMNVSNKPASLKDMFEILSETVQPGQKPLPVLDPSKKQAGMGFVTSQNPSVQNILKNLDPKDVQIVQAPGQQPQQGQQQQATAAGQPNPNQLPNAQQGQMQMKEAYGDKTVVTYLSTDDGDYDVEVSYDFDEYGDVEITGVVDTETGDDMYDLLSTHDLENLKMNVEGSLQDERDDRGDFEHEMRRDRDLDEGAKVDRMVKHIEKSERKLGKSKEKASDIAWATANKRGMLDNKNKKKTNEDVDKEIADIRKTINDRKKRVYTPNHPEKKETEQLKRKLAKLVKSKEVKEGDIPSTHGVDTMGGGLGAGRSDKFLEGKKPDFLDLDKDGNKKEPMKKAAADKKKQKVKESMNHRISAARHEGRSDGLRGSKNRFKDYDDLDEARAYHEGYKDGLDECYGQGVYEAAPAMPAATVPGMASAAMPTMEDDMEEGNAFTAALAKTPKGGKFSVGGKTFTDNSSLEEYAFESLDRQLNALLNESEDLSEGLSVSVSKGQQNSPDSVTITAQDAEADQLLQLVKHAGLGLFGDDQAEPSSAMSVQPAMGEPDEVGAGGVDIDVVDGSEDILSLMQKLGGVEASGSEDYADEEGHDEFHSHGEEEGPEEETNEATCNECGMMEAGCQCDKEQVEEVETEDQMEFEVAEDNAPDSGAEDSVADEDAEAKEDAALAGEKEEEMNESFFDLLKKFSTLSESKDEEDEEEEEDVTESAEEDEEDAIEESEELTEWANQVGKGPGKGTDASFEQDIEFMTKVIAGGLNKPKSTGQTTVPVIAGQDDRMHDNPQDWAALAGIKKS